jgi:hypothetical protein
VATAFIGLGKKQASGANIEINMGQEFVIGGYLR